MMCAIMNKIPIPFILAGVLLFHASRIQAQADTLAAHYAKVITVEDLKRDLEVLASDSYQGRDTGKEGQKMAAEYIRGSFIQAGIGPVPHKAQGEVVEGYFQPFDLVEKRSGSISVAAASGRLVFMKEILYFNEDITANVPVRELVYLADGSGISRYGKAKGKDLLVVDGGTGNVMVFLGSLRMRAEAARQAGARTLFVATPRMPELIERMGHYLGGSRMQLAIDASEQPKENGLQTILVDAGAMDRLLGKKSLASLNRMKEGSRIKVSFTLEHTPTEQRLTSENVLAYVEGTDKKDELIILTAHYDHIGVEDGEVYNGADDDGSGTVAIMAIARAFAAAKAAGHGPRRSILVMPVSAEEKGLLGSRYYSERPLFPLSSTVANLNIDMIGRVDSIHADSEPYVYVIGSDRLSSELHAINEEANSAFVKLDLDYTFNARNDPNRFYYRSDHYNFAKKGIPAIFYFSGVHEDYHQPGDTVDKILFDLLHKRALLVFHTAWKLAQMEERIVVDGVVE